MLDTLSRLGRVDAGAPADVSATLDQVRALLQQLRNHLQHEETFLHTALERRRPGSSVVTSVEHSEHQKAFTELDRLVARCAESAPLELARALKSLYLDLSFFVAENLAHMYREETDTTELLWQLYTDDELRQIEGAIVASETPAELGASMAWMLPAITPQERAGLMGGAKQGLPPEAFAGLMGLAQSALDGVQFRRLQRDLGVG
jgi:Hemerythrin HHE cation binding domain